MQSEAEYPPSCVTFKACCRTRQHLGGGIADGSNLMTKSREASKGTSFYKNIGRLQFEDASWPAPHEAETLRFSSDSSVTRHAMPKSVKTSSSRRPGASSTGTSRFRVVGLGQQQNDGYIWLIIVFVRTSSLAQGPTTFAAVSMSRFSGLMSLARAEAETTRAHAVVSPNNHATTSYVTYSLTSPDSSKGASLKRKAFKRFA